MKILQGNNIETLKSLPDGIVQTCVTSPPYYGLRDYGVDEQIGLEETPELYVEKLVSVFREVWRVLKDDGTLWLNLGDSYWANRSSNGEAGGVGGTSLVGSENKTRAGGKSHPVIKPKDLIGIPWMIAFALRADGWYLRQDIIWHKPNPMPESVKDRCTKAHEYIFLMSKSKQYYYDADAIAEDSVDPESFTGRRPRGKKTIFINNGYSPNMNPQTLDKGDGSLDGKIYQKRNRRDVWTVNTKPYKGAHFATFPTALIEPCILAGSAQGDIVLDPFNGSGTTGYVALKNGRDYIGCELNPEYIKLTEKRFSELQPLLTPPAP